MARLNDLPVELHRLIFWHLLNNNDISEYDSARALAEVNPYWHAVMRDVARRWREERRRRQVILSLMGLSLEDTTSPE